MIEIQGLCKEKKKGQNKTKMTWVCMPRRLINCPES